ncbi:MAG TPA: NlpC/P60 family protein [Mycobacteriales bacterium]|nr:NlpC/P60 family protein [Mycobacteriales bacterium]
MSAFRRLRVGAVVAALASLTTLAAAPVPALAAHGHGGPSAGQIAKSRREVASRERQVRAAAAAVERAKLALNRLNTSAEVAFEAYDEARVKLHAAQHAVHTAHVVLAGATQQVNSGEVRVHNFVTAAYETGGLSSLDAYLSPGGPAELVSRVGALAAVDTSEHTTLQQLEAAQIYQGVVSRQAESVASIATAAAAAANRAKQAALAAVHRQSVLLAKLRTTQHHLNLLLTQAKAHVSKLQRERLAAIAAARARAIARRQAQGSSGPSPYSGRSGNLSGTVSAATALAALQAAESQIGKPYQWGAAGPNSYDCSGLTMWAYDQVGVHLLHYTGDQWNEGAHVSRSELRPGDLVFFATNTSDPSTIHHVGMYVGGGEMVDAPYTGVDVRYDSIDRPDYIGAVRPYQR